jgi:DNA-3-methyladenine glycosylase II
VDINTRIRKGEKHLRKTDTVLSNLIDRHGPCDLMDNPRPHFHTLVWAIINQQLSVKAAKRIEERLLAYLDTDIVTADQLKGKRESSLRRCGLSGAKIRYISELGRRVRSGALDLDALESLDDDRVSTVLMELPGVGRWTADMLLMFSLGRLDVLPIGDLALRKSISALYGLPDNAGAEEFLVVTECWRPYRSIASWYCWAAVD